MTVTPLVHRHGNLERRFARTKKPSILYTLCFLLVLSTVSTVRNPDCMVRVHCGAGSRRLQITWRRRNRLAPVATAIYPGTASHSQRNGHCRHRHQLCHQDAILRRLDQFVRKDEDPPSGQRNGSFPPSQRRAPPRNSLGYSLHRCQLCRRQSLSRRFSAMRSTSLSTFCERCFLQAPG